MQTQYPLSHRSASSNEGVYPALEVWDARENWRGFVNAVLYAGAFWAIFGGALIWGLS